MSRTISISADSGGLASPCQEAYFRGKSYLLSKWHILHQYVVQGLPPETSSVSLILQPLRVDAQVRTTMRERATARAERFPFQVVFRTPVGLLLRRAARG